jgi:translation elongation factor EF-1alpha
VVAISQLDRFQSPEIVAARIEEAKRNMKVLFKRYKIGTNGSYSFDRHLEFPLTFRQQVKTLLLVLVRLRIYMPRDVKMLIGQALAQLSVGFTTFVPCDAWSGKSVAPTKSALYEGPSLMEVLESIPPVDTSVLSARPECLFIVLNCWRKHKSLRFRIKIHQGMLKVNDSVQILTNSYNYCVTVNLTVRSMYIIDQPVAGAARTGDLAIIQVDPGVLYTDLICTGALGGTGPSVKRSHGLHLLLWSKNRLKVGSDLHVHLHGTRVTARIKAILWQGRDRQEGGTELKANQPGEIEVEIISPYGAFCIENERVPSLARFAFKQEALILGYGHVTKILR